MKISIVRGAFLNPFELQNCYPIAQNHQVKAISSLHPINDQVDLPLTKLVSPTDLPNFPFKFSFLNRIFKDAHYLFGLEKHIAGSDIVHVAETYYSYTLQAIKARQKGLVNKVISTVWEIIPHNNESLLGRRRIKKLSLHEIDHFITHTKLAKQALIKERVGESKISLIPLGVDLKRFKYNHSNDCTKKSGEKTILFVGRLVPEKGVEDLVEAFLMLKPKCPYLKLKLIGQGPLGKKIKKFPSISIKQYHYQDMPAQYGQADIFCLPSRTTSTWQEQYGMVLIEAMASGLPIVATNTGAIQEVCGPVALYTNQKNPVSLANKLESLLASNQKLENFKAKSIARSKSRYNHLDTSKKILSIYEKILK